MNFSYSLKQKTKIALLLFCIMCCIILIRILEDRSMAKMGTTFESLYQDRLVPATDLFHIAEKIYTKKHLLETGQKTLVVYQELDKEIDSVITKYQQTFLVEREQNSLNKLKQLILQSRRLEKDYLIHSNNDTSAKMPINVIYSKISLQLRELTIIQTNVGKDLMSDSQTILNGSKIYSLLQFGLAILIGILIVSLIFASNVIAVKQEKFKLN